MKILVIGPYKWDKDIAGFSCLVVGMSKIGVDFDHFPDILQLDRNLPVRFMNNIDFKKISCPDYRTILKNLKNNHYDLLITGVSSVDYNGGKHGLLSNASRKLKYSLVSNKYRMCGTIVSDWIRSGLKLPPIIVVDDKDNQYIWPIDFPLLLNCSLYFKRELPFDRFLSFIFLYLKLDNRQKVNLAKKLKPMWISYDSDVVATFTDINDTIPYHERDIDISHLCNLYSGYNRIKILPFLDNLEKDYKIVTTKDGKLDTEAYFKLIKRSKISLSLEGRGWDCNKHYELMLCRTLLFVTRPIIQLAYELVDGENCVFIDNSLNDFERLAKYYLENPELSEKIANNGYELAVNHLSNTKLAEYVINTTMCHLK